MTRLPVALACLILAAILAAVAYVLARPRWGWEPDARDLDGKPFCPSGYAQRYHGVSCTCPHRDADGTQWSWTGTGVPSVSRDSTAGWAEAGWS